MNITNKKAAALCIVALGGLFSVTCSALTIDITGKVVASPCTINGGDDTLDVNLGNNIEASELESAGNATNWKNFSLKLTNCPPSTTSFSVAFAGTTDSDDANFYANTGTATNLKLALTSQDGKTIFNNGSSLENVLIDASTNAYNLDLRTRAESKGLVMPGTIKGQIQATFTYQ
ncbi:fimbrial protein [Salmonella enterica]|uniref:S-fimbrial adhesin protein SfaS n=2 Tax=Salmonella enterica TaxID=28901 RepID=A0A379QIS8_SALER|nr:fimbrial protein [Salmonella enterica]ECC1479794.1 type 1 fimbrial protein [Salmonella enterica subsp. salamae]EHM1749019.1 type 1 fimbrial protein [Salmonella enterica subsp. salamae serovar 40:c:e,n,x,z15]HCM1997563.1 type 1 fimbrial protein [Salmonella enterica subsp. salamae serovar [1],40:z35:e,n,x,z15]ASG87976.1 adhesin [Salmonella enterica subsp. salamae serovar 55:k:z39 str. 1315K]ECC1653840.1 type 1 fimbrial protein [Salmonella enterica subsp. salamae]